jgi:hypothetical protein
MRHRPRLGIIDSGKGEENLRNARTLISPYTIFPRLADQRRINHDIRFLAVEPGLRVLISVALDADVGVDDHQFNYSGHVISHSVAFAADGEKPKKTHHDNFLI